MQEGKIKNTTVRDMGDPKLLGPGDMGKLVPSFPFLLAQKVDPLSFGAL